MNEAQRRQRNADRLQELYPAFAAQIDSILRELESLGYRPRIQEAYRSPEDQLRAYNSGNSKLKYGFHNVTGTDGRKESLAVDLLDDDRPLNPTTAYLLRLYAAAKQRTLTTGVLWGLTQTQRRAIEEALTAQDWDRSVRTGWDSWHVEPTGLTPAEARQGKRPAPPPPSPPPAPTPTGPYQVLFAGSGHTLTATMRGDRSWLPLRAWGEAIGQAVEWQGEDRPILLGGNPYGGEMKEIDGKTFSPVRDLAAYAGREIDVDNATRTITVREPPSP